MAAFEKVEFPQLAGSVRSPTAALEHSSAQNLGLAERPLCRRPPDRFGSVALSGDWPLSGTGVSLTAFRR